MNGKEKVVEHLKMIQAVINRLGNNSLWVKSWSIVIILVAMILIAKYGVPDSTIVFRLIVPVVGLWILDGYFLWQERLFRQVYDEIRIQTETNFEMNPMKHKNKPKCGWISALFSVTLLIFYLLEILCIFLVFVIIDSN